MGIRDRAAQSKRRPVYGVVVVVVLYQGVVKKGRQKGRQGGRGRGCGHNAREGREDGRWQATPRRSTDTDTSSRPRHPLQPLFFLEEKAGILQNCLRCCCCCCLKTPRLPPPPQQAAPQKQKSTPLFRSLARPLIANCSSVGQKRSARLCLSLSRNPVSLSFSLSRSLCQKG